jgi:hypothetical protein
MLSDHYRGGVTERLLVSIITVDPPNKRIEVVGKDAAVIQVAVGPQTPPLFRWPKQGELWTIVRENGSWGLENLVPGPDDTPPAALNPGDAIAQAEKVWTPSGDYLVRKSELDFYRPHGPFTLSSGPIAAGAHVDNLDVTHNFGSTNYRLLVERIDGGWGYFVNWMITDRQNNYTRFSFYNMHSSITATLVLWILIFPY